jgi:hypothetical protein
MALLVLSSGIALRARADQPTAAGTVPPVALTAPPTAQAPAFETSVGALQTVGALALPVFGVVIAAQVGDDMVAPIILATPLAVGGAICGFGSLSRTHESSCAYTILATVGGAVLTLPLLFMGIAIDLDSLGDSGGSGIPATLILGGLGWFVVQPVAGLATWHANKRLRPEVLPPPRPSARAPRIPGQMTATVVAFSF